ncbi:glycosyltransferase family protein [Pseudogulbenkiania sp. MAI-1]|uniref:glycosyltransferase family protein n=1 Tax=Pseudogulbenkiania sp. MAI-1 TaxID=990370 RepID=UPI00045E79DF|nr:glycosyltransferase [Pseudogulbenkiania sp. MAI-1]
MRVLFYVQSLLGIGHLQRAARLARAMQDSGLEVHVLLGGEESPLVDFGAATLIALPPLTSADARFSTLVDAAGRPLDAALEAERRERVLAALERVHPALLLIESYPFGRRRLRFELQPLIEAARAMTPRPLIVASVRDVLQARPTERQAESAALFRRDFDQLLVHGDAAFLPLSRSFPVELLPAERVHHTGYVGAAVTSSDDPDAAGEVLVSAGGGAVGAELLRCALAARPLSRLATARWRLLCGPRLEPTLRRTLEREAPDGVIVEDLRADFAPRLAVAALSISQAGYNTVLDVLAAGCPAVLVPFEGDNQTEQRRRAEALAAHGRAVVLGENALTPATLAAAVDAALALPPTRVPLRMDGAEQSARLLRRWAEEAGHGD